MPRCNLCGKFREFVCEVDEEYSERIRVEMQEKAEIHRKIKTAIRLGHQIKARKVEQKVVDPRPPVLDHIDVVVEEKVSLYEEEEEYVFSD